MRDFLPDDKARREAVLGIIRHSFSGFGYREIETPVAEALDRLESGDGGDNARLIYRILRRGLDAGGSIPVSEAADLGLRFDLTVPLARFYATHRAELPDVFRSIQVAPVWRAERPQRGRYRQFTQCDIDVVGEPSHLAEVELITATAVTLSALGIEGTTVRINDRRLLHALLAGCGFEGAATAAVLIAVDKLDKVGVAGVEAELRAGGHPGAAVDRLVDFLATLPPGGGVEGARLPPTVPDGVTANLVAITEAVAVAAPEVHVELDPSLVRGMGYYTGPIFEVAHPSATGSVAAGGRYDGMIGRFTGGDVPACGFSIGFERVVDLVAGDRLPAGADAVALLYGGGHDPGSLVRLQRRLAAGGRRVRLVRQRNNTGRLLDDLASEGFGAYAVLAPGPVPDGAGRDAGVVLKPLARRPGGPPRGDGGPAGSRCYQPSGHAGEAAVTAPRDAGEAVVTAPRDAGEAHPR